MQIRRLNDTVIQFEQKLNEKFFFGEFINLVKYTNDIINKWRINRANLPHT